MNSKSPNAKGSLDRLVRRLKTHTEAINQVLREAKKIHPEACLYLAGELHLMSGHHHDDRSNSDSTSGEKARQDRIIGSAILNADGGDW
jgi:hypothetical protein